MTITTALIFLVALVALATALAGLVVRRKSILIGLVAVGVASLAAGGAWIAWAETQSLPWTIGYLLVALCCLASAARQFLGSRQPPIA